MTDAQEMPSVEAGVSSDYLNMVLMTMAGSLVVIGPDAMIKMVNQATLDLTGYQEDDLIGQPMDMLLEGQSLSLSADRLSKKGFIRHGERLYKTRDGSRIPVSFSSAIMRDKNKRVLGIVCVAQDISPLKQLETQLHQRIIQLGLLHQVDDELTHMFSVAHVVTLGLDFGMRLSMAEAGGIALMKDDELVVVESVGYPDGGAGKADFTKNGLVARAIESQSAEYVSDVYTDKEYVPILPNTRAVICIPLISQDKPIGVLNLETVRPERFNLDIFGFLQLIAARVAVAAHNAQLYDTSRRHVDELQSLYAQVSALEQMKTDMIRMAAHDLRNPLNNLSMTAKILRRTMWERIEESEREHITGIEESIGRMQKITSDILSLERIEKAATGEFNAVVDLHAAVQQAFDEHKSQAKLKNQEYTLTVADAVMFVKGEAIELSEAAGNFISNAIKYTPEGGRIEVTLRRDETRAIFEVKDNGYGIPEDQQARLFQPFFRAETAETKNIEGTGLGLHLVKNIIERHKGKIRFGSKLGEGSVFGFEIPVVRGATAPLSAALGSKSKEQ
jgi:PAS domain S-box-containing protein